MTSLKIDNRTARALFLSTHGLSHTPRKKLSEQELLARIDEIGFVQVDSINTVARAHHMILFARNETYRPKQLTSLLEHHRELFENWTHDASIIPSRFFPFWRVRFERERSRLSERWKKWRREGFEELFEDTLAHIRDNGPVMARELGGGEKKAPGGWWDWHPSKTALEYLWRTGELAIARREGFQKVYDLTERVIPDHHREHEPTTEEFIDWACRNALDRLGFATPGELAAFWGAITPAEATGWCKANAGDAIVAAEIANIDGEKPRHGYVRSDIADRLRDLPTPPKRLRILSPFDPAIRDRKRLERLFGFNYRIEVFVPAAKRQYGYYVFPLLEGDRLIGRIDMKHQRQDAALNVTGLWLEPGVKSSRQRMDRLVAELDRHRRFVGADRVTFDDGYLKTGARQP
jgi:uncharacterized protein YcaQ